MGITQYCNNSETLYTELYQQDESTTIKVYTLAFISFWIHSQLLEELEVVSDAQNGMTFYCLEPQLHGMFGQPVFTWSRGSFTPDFLFIFAKLIFTLRSLINQSSKSNHQKSNFIRGDNYYVNNSPSENKHQQVLLL